MHNIINADVLIYHFNDAAVPPPDHRSYTIHLTSTKIHLSVDSYGDILHEEEFSVNNELLDLTNQLLSNKKIRNCDLLEEDTISGSTSESLTIYSANDIVFKGSIYHAGKQGVGNLCGDLGELTNQLKKNFLYFKKENNQV